MIRGKDAQVFLGIVLLTMVSGGIGLLWNLHRAEQDFRAWVEAVPDQEKFFLHAQVARLPSLYPNSKRPFDTINTLYFRHNPRTAVLSRYDAIARRTPEGWSITLQK